LFAANFACKTFIKAARFFEVLTPLFGVSSPILAYTFWQVPERLAPSFPARSGAPMMAGVNFHFLGGGFAAVFHFLLPSLIAAFLEASPLCRSEET